jgi:DNA-binding MarR family transcriptional regulator
MDTISAAALARDIGTSTPRVVRAIERLGISARQDNGRMRIDSRDAERLRAELGPTVPGVAGLSRTEVMVLAALARAPLGLASVRAVAERAGVSPTTASRAVRSLRSQGIVTVRRRDLAAGRAREVELVRLDYSSPRWQALADEMARATPGRAGRAGAGTRVPHRLRHLFWNTAPSQLDSARAGGYIARRLISTGDPEGLAWGVQHLSATDWRHAARTRGLSPERRALALNLAVAAERSRDDPTP